MGANDDEYYAVLVDYLNFPDGSIETDLCESFDWIPNDDDPPDPAPSPDR